MCVSFVSIFFLRVKRCFFPTAMRRIDNDSLWEILAFFCVHSLRGLCTVNRRWKKHAADLMHRAACAYKHDLLIPGIVPWKSDICLAHDLNEEGRLFVKKLRPRLIHKTGFIHFATNDQRRRFIDFVKHTLQLHICTGGTCCGGKGQQVHMIWA